MLRRRALRCAALVLVGLLVPGAVLSFSAAPGLQGLGSLSRPARCRESPSRGSGSSIGNCSRGVPLLGAALLLAASLRAAVPLLSRTRRRGAAVPRRASKEEWKARCLEVGKGKATYEVVVSKPLGVELRQFPNRPGVGVAEIREEGGVTEINKKVLEEDADGMFVLEGDEVVAVNGTGCPGADLETITGLIVGSEGPSVTLQLSRNWLARPRGPVKMFFKPSGKSSIISYGTELEKGAAAAEEDVKFSCQEGWCGTCWHKEEGTGKVFKICQDEVPNAWDNVMPMVLTPAPQKNEKPS